jgi:hypothetical protein
MNLLWQDEPVGVANFPWGVALMKRILSEHERTRIKFVRHVEQCETCASADPSNFCSKGKNLREAYLKAEHMKPSAY